MTYIKKSKKYYIKLETSETNVCLEGSFGVGGVGDGSGSGYINGDGYGNGDRYGYGDGNGWGNGWQDWDEISQEGNGFGMGNGNINADGFGEGSGSFIIEEEDEE